LVNKSLLSNLKDISLLAAGLVLLSRLSGLLLDEDGVLDVDDLGGADLGQALLLVADLR
jgi:hypothetical protein